MWQRWVIDVGITGPDKGEGGKYLFLPPGYSGQVPQGYHVVHSPTFGLWIPWRSFPVHGDPLLERERTTLPEFLRDAGYQTGMVGKWHLGLKYRKSDGSIAEGWDDADLTQPLAEGGGEVCAGFALAGTA